MDNGATTLGGRVNLDKASAASTAAPLAPPDWTMEVRPEGGQYTAVLKRAGVVICRLSVVRPDGDEDSARSALADKARFWVQDYLARSRGGRPT